MTGHQVFGFSQLTDTAELSKPPQRSAEPPAECPRCCSTNTKFCYYNNYNKSQPRHFCKSCKRHWTKGGTLRSIPAGRSRTNKRSAAADAAIAAHPEPQPPRKNKIQKLLSFATDQKNMSNILYRALIQSPPSTDCFNFVVPQGTILESHGTTHAAGLNASSRQNLPNTEFTYSSYYQSSNDSAEESTVTTSAAPPSTASNLGTAADVADLWNWNDQIDSLAGSADFNLVWDHLKFDF